MSSSAEPRRARVAWLAAALVALAVALVAGLAVAIAIALPARADDAPGFASRIAEQIAARWTVDARDVVLDWSRAGDAATLPADAPTRLDGPARDGWFMLLVSPPGAASRALPVRAGVRGPVAVAARDLPGGSMLGAADLRFDTRVRWGAPSRDTTDQVTEGWEVRRPIAAGEPLVRPVVAPPPLVAAGGPVTLEWVKDGVRITLEGVALHAARADETVRVRLDRGRAVVLARVTGPGTARLMEELR